MQDLNGKITGNVLTAAEWNEVPSEIQNVIVGLGQVLSSGDLNQLGKGIAGYVANGTFYTESGVADAYVLSVIGLKQVPTAYTDGFKVRFLAGNANTGGSTINVASLGVKNLKMVGGITPAANVIRAGATIEAVFDGTEFILSVPAPELVVSKTDTATQTDPILRVLLGTDPEVRLWIHSDAQNFIFGVGGDLLNNQPSGTKDGNNNTGYGLGQYGSATTAFACAAYAWNALNSITTGDSDTAIGYQSLFRLTSGKNDTATGVDCGFNVTIGDNNALYGRHVLFDGTAATDFIGSGNSIFGTDIMLLATDTEDCCLMGFNVCLNSTGGTSSNIIGKAAARDATAPNQSNIMGATACQTVVTLLEVLTMGDRAVQNSLSDTQSVNLGGDAFFTSLSANKTNVSNVGAGYQVGFQVWGARNVFAGDRAGAYGVLTEVNDAVCLGHRAGDGTVIDDDLIIANSNASANELIKGNFSTKVMRIEGTEITFRNRPVFADNAAAVAGSHPVGADYHTAAGAVRVVV